jgi:predicted small secreted protein|tara:strand:- start:431 stop:745 length:315 start_codon:yes stop_codon:yes gene_type:complete
MTICALTTDAQVASINVSDRLIAEEELKKLVEQFRLAENFRGGEIVIREEVEERQGVRYVAYITGMSQGNEVPTHYMVQLNSHYEVFLDPANQFPPGYDPTERS